MPFFQKRCQNCNVIYYEKYIDDATVQALADANTDAVFKSVSGIQYVVIDSYCDECIMRTITMNKNTQLDEPVLDDDYPIYPGYMYVVDGEVMRSLFSGTVADIKREFKCVEVRRCDLVGRELSCVALDISGEL